MRHQDIIEARNRVMLKRSKGSLRSPPTVDFSPFYKLSPFESLVEVRHLHNREFGLYIRWVLWDQMEYGLGSLIDQIKKQVEYKIIDFVANERLIK